MRDLRAIEREVDDRKRKELAARANLARKIFPADVIAQIERQAVKDAAASRFQQPKVDLLWDLYSHAYGEAINGPSD